MPNCSINGCKTSSTNAKERQLKLFSFPRNIETRLKWISACKKPYKFNENNARICSKHFTEDAFEKPLIQKLLNYSPTNSRKLKSDAVPTKYLPPFAETEVKIEVLCNEIENIPMDEETSIISEEIDPTCGSTSEISSTSDELISNSVSKPEPPILTEEDSKKNSRDARIAYETLLSTYQKFFTENEELKIKNKALKIECEKHKKLYEKRLQENIKLRQRNRALFNETVKLKSRLKKIDQNPKSKHEYNITDVVECNIYNVDNEPEKSPSDKSAIKKH